MGKGQIEGRELVYIPLTDRDEEVRRDRRYRVGRWLDSGGRLGVTGALLGVIGGVVLLWDLIAGGPDRTTLGQDFLLLTIAIAGVLGLYAWWFFKRQERSELRRAYRFRAVEPEDDEEVAGAKCVLLSAQSDRTEREEAVQLLLGRGACSLNKVSVLRELVGYVVAFAVLASLFVLLVWLL